MAFEALPAGMTLTGTADQTPATTYLQQPEMRALLSAALDRGWTLHGYERVPPGDGSASSAWTTTNAREAAQAENIATLARGGHPLLVWCGNGHLLDVELDEWRPMGARLRHDHDVATFSIDQTCTVQWPHGSTYNPMPHAAVLRAHGGACGFLTAHAPPDFLATGADAYLLSLDNAFT